MDGKYEKMSFRETQLATLELLKKIDKICQELDIQYFIMFGTLIGAIRHKGYIPWDDDIDIGIKAKDYKKFVEYFVKNKDKCAPLEIHNQKTNKDCFYNISRVVDNTYHLEFENMKYTSGTFVDVYPLEGLGKESDLEYWKKRFKKYLILQRGVYLNCAPSIWFGKTKLKRILNLPYMLFARLVGKQFFINRFNKHKRFSWEDSEYIGTPCWIRDIFKKEDFDEAIRAPFEDTEVWIPKNYDSILRMAYGDYMKLPPEDKRVPHHDYSAYRKVN